MASKRLGTNPGCDDERERKRKLSNRESARRSRMRKQQRLDELNEEMKRLKEENKKLSDMIDDASKLQVALGSENDVVRAQMSELSDRLKWLNSVVAIASKVSVCELDSLMEPWQLPRPNQPVNATSDQMFDAEIVRH